MKISKVSILLLSITFYWAYKEPCKLKLATVNTNYLVVKGLINTSAYSTIFTLSRIVPVNNAITYKLETGAKITAPWQGNRCSLRKPLTFGRS